MSYEFSDSSLGNVLPAPRRRQIGCWIPTFIIGAWLAGSLVAAFNHFLFVGLHGLPVTDAFNLTQSQITTVKNTLATAAKILLALSISTSLSQATWRSARTHELSISQLDSLFGLPSPANLLKLWFGRNFVSLSPVLLAAGSIQALILLPIIAPGSLTIRADAPANRTLTSPIVDMSVNPGLTSLVLPDSGDTQPLLSTSGVILRSMAGFSAPTWFPPFECTSSVNCTYTFQYAAPALRCSDLTADQIWDGDEDTLTNKQIATLIGWQDGADDFQDTFVYNATSNLPPRGTSLNLSDPYNMVVSYLPPGDVPNPAGSACFFYNATYEATTTFDSSGQNIDVHVEQYHELLSDPWASADGDCEWYYNSTSNSTLDDTFPLCQAQGVNNRAFSLAFFAVLSGNLQFSTDGLSSTQAFLTPLFDVDPTQDSFTLSVANLSQGLMDLMANTTLAFMSMDLKEADLIGTVISGDLLYTYDRTQFALIYGAALLSSLFASMYGLVCLYSNGSPGTSNFSHFLSTTRSPALTSLALHDQLHALTPQHRETVLMYGNVRIDEKSRVHSFGVVGRDDIIPLKNDFA